MGQRTGAYQSSLTLTTYFYYDSDGELTGFEYGGNDYYYVKNLQNDIIGILDSSGNLVVEYEYDAWGKLLSITGSLAATVGVANPFRYRSYYYDNESGLYYLQSRYYSPDLMRFISVDEPEMIFKDQMNLHSYCDNDPVNYVDPDGMWVWRVLYIVPGTLPLALVKEINKAFARDNHKYNQKYEVTGIVHDPYKVNMRYGKSTVTNKGCGAIAVHNAMILLKGGKKLSDVVYYFDTREILFTAINMSITSMRDYIKSQKYKAIMEMWPTLSSSKNKNLDSYIKNAPNKIAIVAFKYGSGTDKGCWHYITVKWNGTQFELYNYKDSSVYKCNSIEAEFASRGHTKLGIITC